MGYKTLILYSTTDGHTKKICQFIAAEVESEQHQVSCVNIDTVTPKMLENAQQVVLGASIRYGKFHKSLYRFINTHQLILEQKDNAFFGVNLVARKPQKNLPQTNPYMVKTLSKLAWKPKELDVFAGCLDYPAYGLLDKAMIMFIMWMTDGPTDTTQTYEFTCWERVSSFAQQLKQKSLSSEISQ